MAEDGDDARREQLRRMEEERDEEDESSDDDDLFLLFLPLLHNLGRREKRACRTSILTGAKWVKEILEGHEERCRSEFRMEPHIFQGFSNYLKAKDLMFDSRGVEVEEQLGIFMYMLSRNASNRALQERFQHSGETVHRHIRKIFDLVAPLAYKFIKLPVSSQAHPKIRSDYRFWPYFKNCIGAIDGTHIPITISEDKAAPYRNRKGTLSQNVMLACDFDLNFVFVSCGWEGSASDAGVLQSALNSGFIVPNGKFYLVDGGYANTPSFLAPYRGVRYHLKEWGRRSSRPRDHKELFNLRHATMRNHIERAIGILKMRFPILKVATFHPIESQVKIPAAAAVLHNIIRKHKGEEEWLNQEENIIPSAEFVDVPEGDDAYSDDVTLLNTQRNAGSTLRDRIAMDMWNDYVNRRQ